MNATIPGKAYACDYRSMVTSGVSPESGPPQLSGSMQPGEWDVADAIDLIGTGRAQYELLVLVGVFLAADAAEVAYLSFVLGPLMKEWDMSSQFASLIAGMIFAGQIVGAPTWGLLADKHGRRPCFLICSCLTLTCAILTARCRGAWSLLAVRSAVGFGVAGLSVPYTVAAEVLPSVTRDAGLMGIMFFQTLGNLQITFLAWLLLETYGWELFTLAAALPSFLGLVAAFFMLPESPKWLASVDRQAEATEVVNKVSSRNGSPCQFSMVTVQPGEKDQGAMDMVLDRGLRTSFLLMAVIWFGFGVTFYGLLFMAPKVLSTQSKDGSTERDYPLIALTNLAQGVGLFLGMLAIPRAGCRCLQMVAYAAAGLCMLILSLKSFDRSAASMAMFLTFAMAATSAGSCATWAQTPKLFPTPLRATSLSMLSAISRIGGFTAPFVIDKSLDLSTTSMIMGVVSLLAALSAFALKD